MLVYTSICYHMLAYAKAKAPQHASLLHRCRNPALPMTCEISTHPPQAIIGCGPSIAEFLCNVPATSAESAYQHQRIFVAIWRQRHADPEESHGARSGANSRRSACYIDQLARTSDATIHTLIRFSTMIFKHSNIHILKKHYFHARRPDPFTGHPEQFL